MKKQNQNNFNQNRPPPECDLFASYESPLRYSEADFFFSHLSGESIARGAEGFKSSIRKRKSTRARADRQAFRKR